MIAVARPAKHKDEQGGQTKLIRLLLLVSTLLFTKFMLSSARGLTIDRLDHSGHLIRNTLVEKIIILREPFVSCKTKVYGYDTDTSLNIYLKSYAGTVELHVQILYKNQMFYVLRFSACEWQFQFHPILFTICGHLRCKKYATL